MSQPSNPRHTRNLSVLSVLDELCRVIGKTTPIYIRLKEQLESIEYRVQSLTVKGRLHAIPALEVRASAIRGILSVYKQYLEERLTVREEVLEFLEPYAL